MRERIAQVLLGTGERVQYSVFECHFEPEELPLLLARLQSLAGRPAAAANSSANGSAADLPQHPEMDKQVRLMKARNEDQTSEIARLKAALAVFENSVDGDGTTPRMESRIGLKARLQSLEAQSVQQADTILRLRSDLAAANERLARQANHFTNELRRLGAAQPGMQSGRRGSEAAGRLSLTERVAQSRNVPEAANVEPLPVVAKASGAPPAEVTTMEPASDLAATSLAPLHGSRDEAATGDSRPRLLDRIASLGRS